MKVIEQALAAELELGDGPGSGDAEHQIGRHRDRRDEERQANGGECVLLGDRAEIGLEALVERLGEHRHGRQHEHDEEIGEREQDQHQADAGRLGDRVGLAGEETAECGHELAASCRRAQRCRRLSASSMTNEITSITTAMAAAPA